MKRRSRAGGKSVNRRRTVAVTPQDAPRAAGSSDPGQETEVARLARERDEALEQQAATSEVLGIISESKFELQPFLQMVVETAVRLCRATSGEIFLLDGGVYRFAAGCNLDPVYLEIERQTPISPGQGTVVGRVALSRQAAGIDDALTDSLYEKKQDAKIEGARSMIGVPLMRGGEPIGVIALARHRVEPFVEREIALVRIFANQAVIAIEVREREREVTDQARYAEQALDLLAGVSRGASAAVDLRALAFDCLVQFGKSGRWQFGQLWHPDPGTDVIKCSGESYFGGPEFAAFHLSSINLGLQKGEGLPGRVWKNRAPVWIADFDREDNFPRMEAARAASFKSAFAFPVIIDEEVIVIFELYSKNALRPNHTLMDAVVKLERLLGDVLERKRSESALRVAHSELARFSQFSAMGVMTASIAHEIRQPLAGMIASANAGLRWISKKPPDLDEVRHDLTRIVSDGQRANDVLENIRAIFEKDSQDISPVDVNELIREVLALVHLEAQKQSVLVQTELANNLSQVLGNRTQLQQVILNLTINAIEAMSTIPNRGRALRVKTATYEPGGVLILVEDSGTGIDPKNIERIFDALFSTKSHGMGMGLSICRSVIEAHHGRLWVSPGVRCGSVFHVVLPSVGAGPDAGRQ
jgi:signal transduction histidine kinase